MYQKRESSAGYEPQSRDDNTGYEDWSKDNRNSNNSKILIESFEAEKLKRLIDDKKAYFAKATNPYAKQRLQQEILFLENDILPIVLTGSTLLYNEANRYVTQKSQQAISMNCDALLCLIPLREDIPQRYVVGIANPREMTTYKRVNEFDIAIERINTDMPIDIINLPCYE